MKIKKFIKEVIKKVEAVSEKLAVQEERHKSRDMLKSAEPIMQAAVKKYESKKCEIDELINKGITHSEIDSLMRIAKETLNEMQKTFTVIKEAREFICNFPGDETKCEEHLGFAEESNQGFTESNSKLEETIAKLDAKVEDIKTSIAEAGHDSSAEQHTTHPVLSFVQQQPQPKTSVEQPLNNNAAGARPALRTSS